MGNTTIARAIGSILGRQERDHVVQTRDPIIKETWVLGRKLRQPREACIQAQLVTAKDGAQGHWDLLVVTRGIPFHSCSNGQCPPVVEFSSPSIAAITIFIKEAVTTCT